MRVITGIAKGKNLKTLDGLDVRPTSSMVKEAIFSAIQFEIENSLVIDLFAGSGQLGIEALSRGARQVVFIDSSKASIDIIKENLQNCNLLQLSKVASIKATDYLKNSPDFFDIALLDPPYNKNILDEVLPLLAPKMSENGVIVCEHQFGEKLPESLDGFSNKREYKYGKIGVTIFRR
jgi:16S rRNA (guanine966-N2)-methyltransferase